MIPEELLLIGNSYSSILNKRFFKSISEDDNVIDANELRRANMTKTFTFAITHFSVAFTVAYLLTGDFVIGGMLALIEPAVNTVAYYFHERAWNAFGGRQVESNMSGGANVCM